jgi:ABC-type branched-subunit amino acid transport system substrate-binding protein
VTVGQVDDLSSPIPGLFKGAEDGTKAYFAYINSKGGVNGRKLVLDAQDSTFQGGQVATVTGTQIRTDFALVGGFSLLDNAEKPLIDLARVPDVGFSLSPGLSTDPYLYSPLPNPGSYYPLNLFLYLKQKYPQAVKKVGVIWENATASTTAAENAVEAAMKAAGMQIVYDHGVGPFDTNFLPDIISMKNKGVKMFFSTELPDNYAATLAKQFQQQNFKAINIEGAAYSAQLLKLAGSAANNMYISQGYALYLGQDAKTVPAVGLFNKWMNKVSSKPNFEIESVYGWASAMLFAQALQNAGNPPTRSGLVAALNKITFFDAGGLVPPSNPAGAIPSGCFLLAQVQNGKIKRVPPTPATGFYCGSNRFLKEPGYTPMIRPTS